MRQELDSLEEQQEEIEQRIAQLKQGILAMAPLAKEPSLREGLAPTYQDLVGAGITEGIRTILRAAYPAKISPVEIKEQLKNSGQKLNGYKNVMATIHSTLKRMLQNEEIETGDEGLTYGWHRRHVTKAGPPAREVT